MKQSKENKKLTVKSQYMFIQIVLTVFFLVGWRPSINEWLIESHNDYELSYTKADESNKEDFAVLFDNGITSAKAFFGTSYPKKFDIYIHPNRQSLDSTWRMDWNMPDFKSECWMVASGVASKMDILSPEMWDRDACEHVYAETIKTQQLIAHELIHVYHGQQNASPDFSNTEGLDWFVEGLATYASGQCDSLRIAEVRTAIGQNESPEKLDDFWKGKLRYGLSGSLVMYLDEHYGRDKLKKLLQFNKKSDLLAELSVTESELIDGWKTFAAGK